jgi:pyruvate/2-oxoglutarate dehydrogenase complex dihydrolipoamide acyltransferase (E2) component
VRDVTIEVEAPASGILDERCAHLGDCVAVGRRLARIRDDRLRDEQH